MATPKPRPGYNNPWSLMTPKPRPSIILPAAPTAFSFYPLKHMKPVKPTSPTLSSLIPQSNRHVGPEVLQETGWPIRGNSFKEIIPQNMIIVSFDIVLIVFSHCVSGRPN